MPDSYSACEIRTRTESPITTLGGSWWRSRSQEPDKAWANVFPESGGLGTGASRAAMNGQGQTMVTTQRESRTEQNRRRKLRTQQSDEQNAKKKETNQIHG